MAFMLPTLPIAGTAFTTQTTQRHSSLPTRLPHAAVPIRTPVWTTRRHATCSSETKPAPVVDIVEPTFENVMSITSVQVQEVISKAADIVEADLTDIPSRRVFYSGAALWLTVALLGVSVSSYIVSYLDRLPFVPDTLRLVRYYTLFLFLNLSRFLSTSSISVQLTPPFFCVLCDL